MRFERRLEPRLAVRLAVPPLAILAGIVLGGCVIAAGGNSPFAAYGIMFAAAFGSWGAVQNVLAQATPLILTGLAVALPARMGLWNIGGEGQLTIGAVAATAMALLLKPPPWVLPFAMVFGAIAAGALWAGLAALPRALFGLNEIIVTLFLNYIALQLMQYLVNGPWGDKAAIGFAYSRAIPDAADLPQLTPSLTIGILLALVAAGLVGWVANRTPTGLAIRLVGAGTRVADYLGLDVPRFVVAGLLAAGAIAGLAGAIQLMGVTQRLEPGISASYGYSGILVAFLADGSIAGVVIGAVFYGALITGGLALQGNGIPFDISTIVQALIVILVLAGQGASRYRLVRPARRGQAA